MKNLTTNPLNLPVVGGFEVERSLKTRLGRDQEWKKGPLRHLVPQVDRAHRQTNHLGA